VVASGGVIRHAFEDRDRWFGDPRHTGFTLDRVLSPRRLDEIRAGLRRRPAASALAERAGDTTALSIVDGSGNAVSMIQSLWTDSGIVIPGTGILVNGRLNSASARPDHPDAVAGGKTPVYTLHTYMVTRDDALVALGGTPGGHSQVQTNAQVLTNLLDFGQSPQVAVNGAAGQEPGQPFLELAARGSLALTGELPPAYEGQVKSGLKVTLYDEVTGIHATGTVSNVGTATTITPTGTVVSIGSSGSSSSSSSSIPSSVASGVRSSCEAVATNARRACSCRSSCRCISANVRARSPTSSRAPSTGTSTAGSPRASRSAASRSNCRRATKVPDRGMARIRVRASGSPYPPIDLDRHRMSGTIPSRVKASGLPVGVTVLDAYALVAFFRAEEAAPAAIDTGTVTTRLENSISACVLSGG